VNDTPTERVAHDSTSPYLRQCATPDDPGRNDLFHARVPLGFVRDVFAVIAQTPQHTYQVLTKRAARLPGIAGQLEWPPNLWMGVSVEDAAALARIAHLRQVPAAVRFISAEPLLGPLPGLDLSGIDQAIIGGESGPGARPMELEWARQVIRQCRASGTAPFVKQLGAVAGHKIGAGPKGGDWEHWPQDLRIREFPGRAQPEPAVQVWR
jgi:protein gp37